MMATSPCGNIGHIAFLVLAVAGEQEIRITYAFGFILDGYGKRLDQIYQIGFCYPVLACIDESDIPSLTLKVRIKGKSGTYGIGIGVIMALDDYVLVVKKIRQFHFTTPISCDIIGGAEHFPYIIHYDYVTVINNKYGKPVPERTYIPAASRHLVEHATGECAAYENTGYRRELFSGTCLH